MRAALAVFETQAQVTDNVARMVAGVGEAARAGAQLVVYTETALTGFTFSGLDAEADRRLACAADGREVAPLRQAAREHRVWVAFGLLERDGDDLYDSALLLGPTGETALHYRRISSTWRYPQAPPAFREGTALPVADTPFGRTALLLCGDAFTEAPLALARAAGLDLLLLPFARGFDEDAPDEAAWSAERLHYAQTLADVAPDVLAVNALGLGDVGGAFHLRRGAVRAAWPLHTPGLLLADL